MVEDINKLSSLGISSAKSSEAAVSKKSQEVSQDEFLKLLVTQLKNQDPLNPMDNNQFAVDLSQFAQVEQLIGINDKLDSSSANSAGSLASYLGYNVEISGSSVSVKDGSAGNLNVNLAQDVQKVTVEFADASGKIVGAKEFGSFAAGEHQLSLDGLSVPAGSYTTKVKGLTASGVEIQPAFSRGGLVTGFIPGADPKLLVNGVEISPADVTRVKLPVAAPVPDAEVEK